MKTYKQFIFDSYDALKDLENLQEVVPLLIPAAIGAAKLGGAALTAYSAYSAAKNLKKGKYGDAALDALGVIPGGGLAFKGARALGAGKNLARGASAATSVARWSSPARNRPIEKGAEMAMNAVLGTGATQAKNSSTPTNSNTSVTPANSNTSAANSNTSQSNQSTEKKKEFDPKKLPGAGLAIRTDLSSPTMITKSQAEAEQGIENDKPASTNVDTSATQADAQAKERQKAEAKKKAEQALKKKNQELNDKLRPDFAMAG